MKRAHKVSIGDSNNASNKKHKAEVVPSIDPLSFLGLTNRLCDPGAPKHVQVDPKSRLSNEIWSYYVANNQSATVFQKKMNLWAKLDSVLSTAFGCSSHVFGSTLNGFGSSGSDMDLCMFVDSKYDDNDTLADVRRVLRKKCHQYLSKNIELVPAKVPILKIYDYDGNLEIDLSCNNPNSVRNTNLLYCYSQLDWRVRPLVLVIKAWAVNSGINEARFSTLSSYTLTLMIINYLQAGVQPPVLPSLQAIYPNVFHTSTNIFGLPFQDGRVPTYTSNNSQSLGELLVGFFQHYWDFDFTNQVASVRTGSILTNNVCFNHAKQVGKTPTGQWSAYICIEEPLDRSNAARAVIKRNKFDLILDAIDSARQCFRQGYGFGNFIHGYSSDYYYTSNHSYPKSYRTRSGNTICVTFRL